MTSGRSSSRRAILASVATGAVAVAGCREDGAGPAETGDDGGTGTTAVGTDSPGDESEESPDGNAPTTEPGTASPAGDVEEKTMVQQTTSERTTMTPTEELDLREANVTAVSVESSDGSYDLDVTLYHDDDGEDGYANWWQVETLDGDRLGRRELLHAHSTDPFTRSETVEIPDGVSCVVVRGHDQTHGYGGQAITVALESGETRAIRQGGDRTAVTATDCP